MDPFLAMADNANAIANTQYERTLTADGGRAKFQISSTFVH